MSNGGYIIDYGMHHPLKLFQLMHNDGNTQATCWCNNNVRIVFCCSYNCFPSAKIFPVGFKQEMSEIHRSQENMSRMVCHCSSSKTYLCLSKPSAKQDIFGWRLAYWFYGNGQWLVWRPQNCYTDMTNPTQSQWKSTINTRRTVMVYRQCRCLSCCLVVNTGFH